MKTKIISLILIAFAVFYSFSSTCKVYAADDEEIFYKIELVSNITNETIKKGETIVYDVKVSNVDKDLGIALVLFTINNIDDFTIEVDNIDDYNAEDEKYAWETSMPIQNNIVISNITGSSEKELTIGKIKLTAKENATIGTHTIELKDIDISPIDGSSQVKILAENVTTKVTIASDSTDTEDGEDSQGSKDEKDKDENKEDSNKEEEEKNTEKQESKEDKDSNTIIEQGKVEEKSSGKYVQDNRSTESLPYTGMLGFIKIVAFIVVVGLAIFFYKKHEELKNI